MYIKLPTNVLGDGASYCSLLSLLLSPLSPTLSYSLLTPLTFSNSVPHPQSFTVVRLSDITMLPSKKKKKTNEQQAAFHAAIQLRSLGVGC